MKAGWGLVMLLLAASAAKGGTAEGNVSPADYSIRLAVLGDRTGGAVPGIYEQIVAEISRLRPDLVITVGDMIEGDNEDSTELERRWVEYEQIIRPLRCPIYFTPGNQDIGGQVSEAIYRRCAGEPYYSFNHRQVHVIVLDNSRWDNSAQLPAEQIEWCRADLEAHPDTRYTIVFMHRPFWVHTTAQGLPDTLHTLFKTFGVDAVFTGHYHMYFSGAYDGIHYTGIGSSGGGTGPGDPGPGYHFAWVTIDSSEIAIAPITMGAVLPWDVITAADRLLANRVERGMVRWLEFATADASLKVAPCSIRIVINNIVPETPLNDTARWEVPPGWSVTPERFSLALAPGERREFAFRVESPGPLYPLPALAIPVPYSGGRKLPLRKDLRMVRPAPCVRAEAALSLDGRLDESIWSTPVTGLYDGDGNAATIDSTAVYFAYDDANLYVGARCVEERMDLLKATVTERDGPVYGEDCIGLILQPDPDSSRSVQIYVNAAGAVYDQQISARPDGQFAGDEAWNSTCEAAVVRGDRYWSVELRLPLAEIGARPERGRQWGLNFRRKQSRNAGIGHWQIPWHFDPANFGRLVFE